MRQKSNSTPVRSENLVRDIRRATRKHHAAEEKIRIVLDGLRGETSIAELCRREGIAESMYYSWSKAFLEAGKRRLAGDTARAATTDELSNLGARALCRGVAARRRPGRVPGISRHDPRVLRHGAGGRRRNERTAPSLAGFQPGIRPRLRYPAMPRDPRPPLISL